MAFDVLIIGAGPAGLATAIRLADNAQAQQKSLSICVLEKGAYVGAHIISGAVFDSTALSELIPDWQAQGAPVTVKANRSELCYLTSKKHYKLPELPAMHQGDNYIISLGELCQWLGNVAEQKGVNIFPGFSAVKLVYDDTKTRVLGAQTSDTGEQLTGITIFAQQTILAEGCRGSLSEEVIAQFNLRAQCDMQTYALGIKELWRINPSKHAEGRIIHTMGWPLKNEYGGGFAYHFKDHLLSLGFVVGLDYKDPLFSPFDTFQRFKQHPLIADLIQDADCISYGARALNEGGYQAIPQLHFPGGALVGCSAGFVNVAKIKGIHNALRSGMILADSLLQAQNEEPSKTLDTYSKKMANSLIFKELYLARNIRPSFQKGNWFGMLYSAIDQYILRGHAPFTFHYKKADHAQLQQSTLPYQAPSFTERLNKVFLTGTMHREGEASHLILKDPAAAVDINYKIYNGPESRYCPAGVYEFINKDGDVRLQINSANCIHCKTCDIKDPTQNIKWTVPEGGDGPNYQLM